MAIKFSGEKIMMERINQGKSIAEVSKGADLDPKTLSRIERSLTAPRPATVGKIAKVLNKSILDFEE